MVRSGYTLLFLLLATFIPIAQAVAEDPPLSSSKRPLWGFALDGFPLTDKRLQQEMTDTKIHPDLIVFFLAWPSHGEFPGHFPESTLDAIRHAGALPCLTWEPMSVEGGEKALSGDTILSGAYDPFLRSFARAAALWNKPFLIRFAHEMNLGRYHWGTTAEQYGPESPGLYQRVFRYIVGLFREEGARQVQWVFCPNAASVPQASWNTIAAYYPGDDVIDWLGVDGYNWGETQTLKKNGWDSHWQSFEEIFGQAVTELRALNPSKPLLVCETASVRTGGSQSLWLKEALDTAKAWNLAGIAWFQVHKENDWRLEEESLRVLRQAQPWLTTTSTSDQP